MPCIYDNDAVLDDEEPFSVRTPRCFCCSQITCLTERPYTSDHGHECGGEYFNLGMFFPVIRCCWAPLCLNCTYEDNISCSFCGQRTKISFINKKSYFDFFRSLDQFDDVLKLLGQHATAFFRWHKVEYSDLHDWRFLYPDSDFVARVKKFTAAIECSKIAHCKTIYLLHANPIFQQRFKEQRRISAKFLGECYHARYPIVFQKRDVVSEYHFGFLRVLVARMSCSNTEPINRRIFLAIINSFAAKRFLL